LLRYKPKVLSSGIAIERDLRSYSKTTNYNSQKTPHIGWHIKSLPNTIQFKRVPPKASTTSELPCHTTKSLSAILYERT
jgi:hypothetical protein